MAAAPSEARLFTGSDADLVALAAAGEAGAFAGLMRRHNRMLFRTARAILRDDAEAEDALQEAYLQAYRSLGSFRAEARFSTWLARIVANEALMRLRKQARRASIVPLHSSNEGMEDVPGVDIEKPEASAERAEMRRLLEAQIDALPEDYRTVFMLRAVEELSAEEAAEVLEIPAATVRTRFFRARGLRRHEVRPRAVGGRRRGNQWVARTRGEMAYVCRLDPMMRGVVIVK